MPTPIITIRRCLCVFTVWFCLHLVGFSVHHRYEQRALATSMTARVDNCHDGDTCRLHFQEHLRLNVRLAGIDAPEVANAYQPHAQAHGEAARDFVNQLVKNKIVTVIQRDLDRYNRPVVELWLTEAGARINVNLKIIEQGFAEVYREKRHDPLYQQYIQSENIAKQNQRGIWRASNYESPSVFRQRQTRKKPKVSRKDR